jgi:5-methylthioribose kinase
MEMLESGWRTSVEPMLRRSGFHSGVSEISALPGGVSSDIVLIVLEDGSRFCAKRALPQLNVEIEWRAPLERNHYETKWLRVAEEVAPGSAPKVIDEDAERGIVILEYLPPERFVLWKSELLSGTWDSSVACSIARTLGTIHSATWQNCAIRDAFPTDAIFDALRLDPYLRFLAEKRPDLRTPILSVVENTASTLLALVHGDVSPKNIFVDRCDRHPVLLDAECAWYGDPAFDAAFCLNHLILKAVHIPHIRPDLITGAMMFVERWLDFIPSAFRAACDERIAALLPCLLLARVDGKSPVEYLSTLSRELIRVIVPPSIANPPKTTQRLMERLGKDLYVRVRGS